VIVDQQHTFHLGASSVIDDSEEKPLANRICLLRRAVE